MDVIWQIKKIIQNRKYRKLKIGKNSKVNLGVNINRPENMEIGDNTYINGGIFSIGSNSRITIGNDCLISYDVFFRTFSHNYLDSEQLIRRQGEWEKDIVVGNDVWIGYGAKIMPGVRLNDGCVVGAGAVVTKDVDAYTVVAGIPARMIKKRYKFN